MCSAFLGGAGSGGGAMVLEVDLRGIRGITPLCEGEPNALGAGSPRVPRERSDPSVSLGRVVRSPAVSRRRTRLAAVGAAILLSLTAVGGILGLGDPGPGDVPTVPSAPGTGAAAVPDPYAWDPGREDEFVRRAAAGTSHLLYPLSPGGVVASAARTARWRPQVERAAKAADVDPDTLEGLVFLESAGREDAITPAGIRGAAGLTQILAETGSNLLGMHVDTARSARDTRRIVRAARRGRVGRVAKLERDRARADERFDPANALAGTARHLKLARQRFGRQDLAFVSYHMGIGNLEGVLHAFGAGDVSYARVYFDSTPARHAAAYRRLASFGDDSSNYVWKLGAAMEIMRLARHDPAGLARANALQTAADDARLVLHPPGSAPTGGERPLPSVPADTGLRAPAGIMLRPEALGAALYIGAEVRAVSRAPALGVTRNSAGWAFSISRRYASRRQALAFQYVLDRLQVLNVIAWSRAPRTIDVTAARDAAVLAPLLDRAQGRTP